METNKINNYICKLCDIDLVVEIFIYQLDLVIKMRLKNLEQFGILHIKNGL